MSLAKALTDDEMPAQSRAIIEDIKKTRNADDVNRIWRVLANNPELLRTQWEQTKRVMQPGALDALTKELIYIAVSAANSCEYCLHTHHASARAKGMTDDQFNELMQVIALATLGNRTAITYQVEVDERYRQSGS